MTHRSPSHFVSAQAAAHRPPPSQVVLARVSWCKSQTERFSLGGLVLRLASEHASDCSLRGFAYSRFSSHSFTYIHPVYSSSHHANVLHHHTLDVLWARTSTQPTSAHPGHPVATIACPTGERAHWRTPHLAKRLHSAPLYLAQQLHSTPAHLAANWRCCH